MAVAPVVKIWPLQVRWLAAAGSRVTAGDRIVEFDNAQLASRLEDERSAIVSAESALDQARASTATEAAAARLEVARQRAALAKAELAADLPEGVTSEQELANRRQELQASQLRLAQAEMTLRARQDGRDATLGAARQVLEEARLKYEQTRADLERLVVRAPSDGVLLLGESMEGSVLRVGDQTWPGNTVARIPDLSTLQVVADLYDVDDGLVAPGMEAEVILDTFPEEVLTGVVAQVEEIAQPMGRRTDRRSFRVLVAVEGIDPTRMRPGMSVRVEVSYQAVEDAWLVPRHRLVWRGEQPHLEAPGGELEPVSLLDCSTDHCALSEAPFGMRSPESAP